MRSKEFWSIIENFKGSEEEVVKWAKKASDSLLLEFLDFYGEVHESAYESIGMRRLENKKGYFGDYVDYVIEGSIMEGKDFFNNSKKTTFDEDSEEEGVIHYPIQEELEKRGIET